MDQTEITYCVHDNNDDIDEGHNEMLAGSEADENISTSI